MDILDFKLNYYFKSEIGMCKGKNFSRNEPDCDWYDVYINFRNSVFNYNKTQECMLESEIRELYYYIDKCLSNELEEEKTLWDLEPDLEFLIYKSKDGDRHHLMEFKICIYEIKEGYTGDYYSILFGDKEMILLRDYIAELLHIKKANKETVK